MQPNLLADEEAGACRVADHALVDVFYGECSEEDASLAIGRLVPEHLLVLVP